MIGGEPLTAEDVEQIARAGAPTSLAPEAEQRLRASQAALVAALARGERIYGLSTGVGTLEVEDAGEGDERARQRRLLYSHAAGVGEPMPDDQVRAMMVARASALAVGHSGVRPELVQALLTLLDRGVTPVVPSRGSIGASDLAPLAHMALVLLGEGRARVGGQTLAGGEALARAGLEPWSLKGREAFALINGLAQTAGVGALVVADASRLLAAAEAAAALSLVSTGAPRDFLDERVARAKLHPGQAASAATLRALLGDGPAPTGPLLRADLSARYAPQVAGAFRTALELARQAVERELAGGVDNPMVFAEGWVTSNSGVTSGQEVAQALDLLAASLTSLAVIAERRLAALLDPTRSGGLPAFLRHPSAKPGLDSGLMIAQYTAAALVAELRQRSHPAGIQSIPVCGGREDHASMSALAARNAAFAVEAATTVVAIELYAACQAVDLAGLSLPPRLAAIHAEVRRAVPVLVEDRLLADDLEAVRRVVASGRAGG